MSADQIGLWAGFILTLMVFSYLLGDNFLYRIAVYIFVGLAAGYVTMVTVESVILPWVRGTLGSGDLGTQIVGATPLVLGGLLLFKSSRRFSRLGNLSLAFIIGVGTAVALVGAISGTLLPLVGSTANSLRIDLLNGFIIVLGVVCTLVYFQYQARRTPTQQIQRSLFVRTFGTIGEGFIVITLGALYGGAILTGITVVSERIAFILTRIGGG